MKNIVIVEDNEDNQALVEKILKFKGYASVTFENALEAIEYLRNNTPDLILMDVSLPEMDGLEATRILRNFDNLAFVPIIALSAHVMQEEINNALEAGCSDYLAKPFMPQQLIAVLGKFLS